MCPSAHQAAFYSSKLPRTTSFFHMIHFMCCDYWSWFQNNLNNLFLVLDKMCIPTAKSKSAAYYANVIFTRAFSMVSWSESLKALSLGQCKVGLLNMQIFLKRAKYLKEKQCWQCKCSKFFIWREPFRWWLCLTPMHLVI